MKCFDIWDIKRQAGDDFNTLKLCIIQAVKFRMSSSSFRSDVYFLTIDHLPSFIKIHQASFTRGVFPSTRGAIPSLTGGVLPCLTRGDLPSFTRDDASRNACLLVESFKIDLTG